MGRLSITILIAWIAYGSVKAVAAVEAIASTAWAMTSIPVFAVMWGGIVAGIAGSRIAMSGTMSAATIGYLMWFLVSVMTLNAVISLAVPLVDGMAMNRALFRRGGIEPGSMISSNFSSGYS